MPVSSLVNLSDELLHEIVECFDTARDVTILGSLCQRTNIFTSKSGWRTFVRNKFPSLVVPSNNPALSWDHVANRLTYLDRCWAKRGFLINCYQEEQLPQQQQHHPRRGRGRGRGGARGRQHPAGNRGFRSQTVSFYPALDACLLPSSLDELVVVGAGEDVVARRRPNLGSTSAPWLKLVGAREGFNAGTGDVTAVSILGRHDNVEVAVGRADGALQLRSLHSTGFKDQYRVLHPGLEAAAQDGSNPVTLGHLAITWTAWQPDSELLASCQSHRLRLYNLSDSKRKQKEFYPEVVFEFPKANQEVYPLLKTCKFLNSDTIACGLGGSSHPLQWGKITPTGITMTPIATSVFDLYDLMSRLDVEGVKASAERQTVRAIEPVSGFGNANVMLSAWDDSTIRLMDLRTPSVYDAVYQDRFQPYQPSSSLIAFGSERFVAGDNRFMELRFFDFRNPNKSYRHSDGLPCSDQLPSPVPSFGHVGLKKEASWNPKCDKMSAQTCAWHGEIARNTWQPDATLNVSHDGSDRCFALAKVSDVTGSFYAGFCGTIMEFTPKLGRDVANESEPYQKPPKGWSAGPPRGRVSLIETGVSLCNTPESSYSSSGMPEPMYLNTKFPHDGHNKVDVHGRLDSCWTLRDPNEGTRWVR